MNTNVSKAVVAKDKEIKKHMLTAIFLPFISISFLTIGFSQYSSMVPSWLWYSGVLVMAVNVMMLLYGFWIRKTYKTRYQLGYFFALYLLLISIQCFIGSNIQYVADEVNEELSYFAVSFGIYFVIVAVVSVLIYVLSSPSIFFKDIKNAKTYLLSTLGGVLFVFISIMIMSFLKSTLFDNPEAVSGAYDLLMAATPIGYGAVGLMIIMHRAKQRGDQ